MSDENSAKKMIDLTPNIVVETLQKCAAKFEQQNLKFENDFKDFFAIIENLQKDPKFESLVTKIGPIMEEVIELKERTTKLEEESIKNIEIIIKDVQKEIQAIDGSLKKINDFQDKISKSE